MSTAIAIKKLGAGSADSRSRPSFVGTVDARSHLLTVAWAGLLLLLHVIRGCRSPFGVSWAVLGV